MDYSLPGSSVLGILKARVLEWVAFPSPGDLPDPGIKPGSPSLQAETFPLSHQGNSCIGHQGSKIKLPLSSSYASSSKSA